MSRKETMQDPRFASVLLAIESKLHESDGLAAARGLPLTDSNIRSLLVRAINQAKGKAAKSLATSDRDLFLAQALDELSSLRAMIVVEDDLRDGSIKRSPFPTQDWIAALEAIKDSCEVRTGGEPGSRGYLNFLQIFIGKARVAQ